MTRGILRNEFSEAVDCEEGANAAETQSLAAPEAKHDCSLLEEWKAVREKTSEPRECGLGQSPIALGVPGAPHGPYAAILVGPVSPPENATAPEALCRLPVPEKAANACSLWFHTDSARLIEAYCLVEARGFKPRALLTLVWGHGLQDGPFVENTTYVLLAVRGEPQLRETNQGTLVVVDGGEAYEQLLEVIETVCEGGKLLFNCEVGHPGWDDWPKFEYETH